MDNLKEVAKQQAGQQLKELLLKVINNNNNNQQKQLIIDRIYTQSGKVFENVNQLGLLFSGIYSAHFDWTHTQHQWDRQKMNNFVYEFIKQRLIKFEANKLRHQQQLQISPTVDNCLSSVDICQHQKQQLSTISGKNVTTELIFLFAGLLFLINTIVCLYIKRRKNRKKRKW